jgi:PhnB protein
MPDRNWQELESVLTAAPRVTFRARLRAELERGAVMATTQAAAGIHTVTPYVRVVDIEGLLAFATQVLDGREVSRTPTSMGGIHCLVSVADSMLVLTGGSAAAGQEIFAVLHVYVPDVDACYWRALDAGAESLSPPSDRFYGERNAGVKDPTGNMWYVASRPAGSVPPPNMRAVTPYIVASGALELVEFLKDAFGAEPMELFKRPDGTLMHGAVTIGDSVIELGDNAGVPPSAFYLLVPDVDAVYDRALRAGAKGNRALTNQPHGHRSGGVTDPWGNTWYIASELE